MSPTDPARGEVDAILGRLRQPGASALDLLESHHLASNQALWRGHVELYRAFGKRLIGAGHPTRAIELIREGQSHHKDDLHLKYLLALALARGGNVGQAEHYIQELLAARAAMPADLQIEALSLQGRYFKDRYQRARDPALRKQFAEQSADHYRQACAVREDLFPLINYATMSLLAGEVFRARELAETVVRIAEPQTTDAAARQDYWLFATLAVARVILGRGDLAIPLLREAIRLAGDNVGDVQAMRRDMLLLKEKLVTESLWEDILSACQLGNVMVFAGHLLDTPFTYQGRFPPDPALLRRVEEEIQKVLRQRNVTVGYCSASSGADVLFAEQLLARPGAELHVVLPFAREDFFKTSVDFGLAERAAWRLRSEAVLARARQNVHYATTESYLGNDVLFEFLNTFLHGLALTRAAERGVDAEALVVVDPTLPGESHGTSDFVRQWQQRNGADPHVIDLAGLRREVGLLAAPERLDGPPPSLSHQYRRQIQAMLFADIKGFSKLPEAHFPPFFASFLREVRDVLKASPAAPVFTNTWGDALFAVFDDVPAAGDFALRLLERVRPERWGLPPLGPNPKSEPLALRVGLHTGPVFRYRSPILDREDFFGSHVNRAARIEPVTTPGCAFASEQFAAALAVRSDHDLVCEFVGIEDLAKGFDRCPLYRLLRR